MASDNLDFWSGIDKCRYIKSLSCIRMSVDRKQSNGSNIVTVLFDDKTIYKTLVGFNDSRFYIYRTVRSNMFSSMSRSQKLSFYFYLLFKFTVIYIAFM